MQPEQTPSERTPSDKTPSARTEFSPLSILRMLWKRKVYIAIVWVLVSAGTVGVVRRLPTIYSSEAVILVDSQKIPEKFVSATVATDLQDRIATIKQQLLSSGKLKKIMDDFGLYREERKGHFEEEILEMMRKDITIKLESSGTANRPGAFRIGYQGSDPAVVAQVANRLTNLYVEENLKTREIQAEGTSEFLETQLQEAKKRLDELEAAISTYKLKHNGELPQQENSLNGTLSRLQIELEANRDAINRAEQTSVILGNSLNLAEANVAAHMRPMEVSAGPVAEARTDETQTAQPARPARKKSEVLEEQFAVLRMRYSAEHPDMIRMRRDIERLRRAEEQEPTTTTAVPENTTKHQQTASRVQPPAPAREPAELTRAKEQVATLKAQIKVAEKEVEDRKTEQRRILRDLSIYQSRIERLPVREQEMVQITRDYEISKTNYRSLLDKKIAAEMATDMERRQKSERFTILDPARVPEKPIKPKRQFLYGIGSAAGLLLALFVGFSLELRKNVILGEWELPPDTPVLARLPSIQVTVPATVRKNSHGWHRRVGVRAGAGITTLLTLGVPSTIMAGLSYIARPL